jgi:hypothetical protein
MNAQIMKNIFPWFSGPAFPGAVLLNKDEKEVGLLP